MKKISKNKTAMTYARAWLDAAVTRKDEDNVFAEVKMLQKSISQNYSLWSVLCIPAEDNQKLVSLVENFAKEISLSEVSSGTLSLLATNRRLNLLALILDDFCKLYYSDHNITEVSVETAVPLNENQNKLLVKTLENKLQTKIVINYHINPEILGGLNVRFKSFQIDDTLSSKLEKIKSLMIKQGE